MTAVLSSKRNQGRVAFLVIGFMGLVLLPALMSEFRLSLLAKYLCFAIVAVGIDLAWGYGGMLTLGQGLFFGLGGYAMGMFLKLQEAGPQGLPDFMSYNGLEKVPAFWEPFRHAWFALPAALLIPMGVAAGLGALVFRQRIRGAYFAILTQALAAAFVILLIGQQGYTAGTNGLTNMKTMFGYDLNDPTNQRNVYLAVAVCLGIVYLVARQLVASRYGRLLIAVRDGEDRVRFLGYNPTTVKVLAFTVSAGMAGLAGALFVPVVGIMSPAALGIVPSLELLIGVAVGGRATLIGAVGGTILVNYAKTGLSEQFASGWLYLQGALFILVVAFAPKGLAGIRDAIRRRRATTPTDEPAVVAQAANVLEAVGS
jgi:urea transport system permease protein